MPRGSRSFRVSSGIPIRVLAVDPGREKCGLAVVDERDGILARGVVPLSALSRLAVEWTTAHRPVVLLLGGGTASRQVRKLLSSLDLPVETYPEAHTTIRARRRYFEEHPPRGWRRLIPQGMQTPPIPIDDYAAVLIAEDYLAEVRPAK